VYLATILLFILFRVKETLLINKRIQGSEVFSMTFEMQIVSNTPLTGEEDFDTAAKMFFEQIGYLSKGSDPTIPYKIFADYFLKHPTKAWFVDDIAATLKTSRPTVYRHLNKLKGFDILEEVSVFDDVTKQQKKAYRLRYGNFQKAWNFVEAHIKVAVENYTKTVEHLQTLVETKGK
jgi:predicted transcriptional regulator